jgi:CheY-like chemotaxis protein
MQHILVADDDEMVCTIVSRMLSLRGYRVTVAGDGAQALDHLVQAPVDLVLTDFQMPEMGGRDLLFQARGRGCDVPFVGMSGNLEEGCPPGFEAFVAKPFRLAELLDAIDEVLARQPVG